jgi:hypothetical protein
MDLLTVILACSLHPDDRLVEAFIRKVSDANPFFLGDYVSLVTHDDLTSAEEVLNLAASISQKGGRPALGLMAIPISWAARFDRTPTDLLDGCTNISIGTAMMASFASECGIRARHPGRGSIPFMTLVVPLAFLAGCPNNTAGDHQDGSADAGDLPTDAAAPPPVVPTGALGAACGANTDCASGFCTDSVCCDSACGQPCYSCAQQAAMGHCAR